MKAYIELKNKVRVYKKLITMEWIKRPHSVTLKNRWLVNVRYFRSMK